MRKNIVIFGILLSLVVLAFFLVEKDKTKPITQVQMSASPKKDFFDPFDPLAPLSKVYVNTKYHYQVNYPETISGGPRSEYDYIDTKLFTYVPPIEEDRIVKFSGFDVVALSNVGYAVIHQNLHNEEKDFPQRAIPENLKEFAQELRDLEVYKTSPNNKGREVSELQGLFVDGAPAYRYDISNGFDDMMWAGLPMFGLKGGTVIITQSPYDKTIFVLGISNTIPIVDILARRIFESFHFLK